MLAAPLVFNDCLKKKRGKSFFVHLTYVLTYSCRRYVQVLYISCNPEAMLQNAARGHDGAGGLSKTHDLVRFAVFDHFPYTRHIECGACFVRR